MSQIVTLKQKQEVVKAKLTKAMPQIQAALPQHMKANSDRMFRVYLTACNSSPTILDCEPISIVGAVMRAAAFGLSLETVTGEAFIIPRRNNKLGRMIANFQIGYKGLRKLALQGDPDLIDMFAYPVYENDTFSYTLGMRPEISTHHPASAGSRGKLVNAYAVAVWKSDYRRFRVIDADDIKLAMARAGGLSKPDSPWNTNPAAMWSKTAMIRLCNQLVLSSDVAKQLEADGTDGYQALRDQADQNPAARGMLVDIGATELLAEYEEGEHEEAQQQGAASPLDAVAERIEKEDATPRRQRRARPRRRKARSRRSPRRWPTRRTTDDDTEGEIVGLERANVPHGRRSA